MTPRLQVAKTELILGMNKMSRKTTQLAAVLVAAALALSGCTTPMNSSAPLGEVGSVDSALSGMDIMFAQMMIPHHEQAIDMGLIAASRSENPEILQLANTISNEQEPEIDLMRSWIAAAGASEEMSHAGHGMDGMLTEGEMAALLNASGNEFDELFLTGMIAHHEGAISMAQMVLDSSNPEVRALAEAIVSSQQEQIDYMRTLLAK